jgi:dolichol-phosphate mannosyltransferase
MNSRPSNLYIVVPVFNEAGNLERLFESFRVLVGEYSDRFEVKIVVVDDGSNDGTAALAQTFASGIDFQLLGHEVNRGPGAAFATAFNYLTARLADDDWVLTIEGDNTSRITLLRQMFHRAEEGYDTIFASPYMYGGAIINTTSYRIILSNIANTFVKEFLGINGLLTVSSFFRLYRASVLRKLQRYYGPSIIERRGFECMVEMAMKMVYLGITISEVPMVLDTKLRVGKSKMKVMRTIRGYFWLWRLRANWKKQIAMAAVAENSL